MLSFASVEYDCLPRQILLRGIDVNDITHVIHYDIPESFEAYTHRSGEQAAPGKKVDFPGDGSRPWSPQLYDQKAGE